MPRILQPPIILAFEPVASSLQLPAFLAIRFFRRKHSRRHRGSKTSSAKDLFRQTSSARPLRPRTSSARTSSAKTSLARPLRSRTSSARPLRPGPLQPRSSSGEDLFIQGPLQPRTSSANGPLRPRTSSTRTSSARTSTAKTLAKLFLWQCNNLR